MSNLDFTVEIVRYFKHQKMYHRWIIWNKKFYIKIIWSLIVFQMVSVTSKMEKQLDDLNNNWCRWRDIIPWSWYDGKLSWWGYSWAWAVTVCNSGSFYAGLGWGVFLQLMVGLKRGWGFEFGLAAFWPGGAVWFES